MNAVIKRADCMCLDIIYPWLSYRVYIADTQQWINIVSTLIQRHVKIFFFAFRFSIFEFEYRKAESENQTKLLLPCKF